MSDLAQRLELALATATATVLSAHAHLGRASAARLSGRLPAGRALTLYCRMQHLSPMDTTWVRMQALAHMGAFCPQPAVPAGAGSFHRILRGFREWLRTRLAPHGDRALQEMLHYEFAHARAVLLKVHIRCAIHFAAALRPGLGPLAAVTLYLERMHVPEDMAGAVYAVAIEQLDAVRFAALLPTAEAQDGRAVHDHKPDAGVGRLGAEYGVRQHAALAH